MIKVQEMTGRGILYAGGMKFMVLSEADANGLGHPISDFPSIYCSEQVDPADDGLLFRNPAWLTIYGGGIIRWFPAHRKVQVEIVE